MPASYKNCETHFWPRYRPGGSIRSIGTVEFHQCNNCLAMKVKFFTDVLKDGEWVRLEEEHLLEPTFGLTKEVGDATKIVGGTQT